MNDELISVIIPVYNVEQYLDRCVQSVLNQTYRNLEILLVDDGSPDRCPQMCDEYARQDSRVKVIHKENGGLSSARNAGLEIVTGNYIGFVDSDDYIASDMYEILLKCINNYDADIAMCDYTRKSHTLEKDKTDFETECRNMKLYAEHDIDMLFFRTHGEKSFYSVWNRIYKRDIVKDIYFIENMINEDVLFTYEIYKKANKIAFLPSKKYLYYKNPQGITRSKLQKKDLSLIEIWNEIVRREQNSENEKYAEINRKRVIYTLYVKKIIYGANKDISKTMLRQWKNEIISNKEEISSVLDWKRKVILWLITMNRYL